MAVLGSLAGVAAVYREPVFPRLIAGTLVTIPVICLAIRVYFVGWKRSKRILAATILIVLAVTGVSVFRFLPLSQHPIEQASSPEKDQRPKLPDQLALVAVADFQGDATQNVRLKQGFLTFMNDTRIPWEVFRARDVQEVFEVNDRSIGWDDFDRLKCFAIVYGEYGITDSALQATIRVAYRENRLVDDSLKVGIEHFGLTVTIPRDKVDSYEAQTLLANGICSTLLNVALNNAMIRDDHVGANMIADTLLLNRDLLHTGNEQYTDDEILTSLDEGERHVRLAKVFASYGANEMESCREASYAYLQDYPDDEAKWAVAVRFCLAQMYVKRFREAFENLCSFLMYSPLAKPAEPVESIYDLLKSDGEQDAFYIRLIDENTLLILEKGRLPIVLTNQPLRKRAIALQILNLKDPFADPDQFFEYFRKEILDLFVEIASEINLPSDSDQGVMIQIRLPIRNLSEDSFFLYPDSSVSSQGE
jgi:hypothetical protein